MPSRSLGRIRDRRKHEGGILAGAHQIGTMPFAIDAFHLARAQFAFTVAFHIVFPAFSIGLASYLAVLEGLHLWTKKPVYMDVYRFWLRIFAVGFAMGVVRGW